MQLHNRMGRAAASEADSAALVLLKDNALKKQCSRCSEAVRPPRAETDCYRTSRSTACGMRRCICCKSTYDERNRTMRVRLTEVG